VKNLFLEVILPYTCFAIFVIGIIYRIYSWAKSPVPLKITTTCGQQKTIPGIKRTFWDRLDCPYTKWEVILRMIAEVFFFRSLFRNTRYIYFPEQQHRDTRWLWLFAMMFHWSLLIVLLRHLRFFLNPVPDWVLLICDLEAQKAMVPALYVTGVTLLVGLLFLLGRRLFFARERAISLPSDYLILFLLIGIAVTGLWMRYIEKVPLTGVKELAVGLATLHPVTPDVHWLFLLHFSLACITIAYFPFSKLVHSIGVLLSPTRVLANNPRAKRWVNPWNVLYTKMTWEKYYERYKDQLDDIAEQGYKVKPEI